MTPGPTMVPAAVMAAEAQPMIHHRTAEYSEIFSRVCCGLQYVFQTNEPVLTYPSAGTGAMEAAIVNFFSPGDKVLAISIGVFGDRFASIATAYGLDVEKLSVPWGQCVDLAAVSSCLELKSYRGVLITHNETSTGAMNDIRAVAELVSRTEALYVVDAVSSMGALDLQMDNWKIDVVVAASQKALMTAPGLSFLAASQKAVAAGKTAKCPRFYWDYQRNLAAFLKEPPQNPYTPAVSLIRGLDVALQLLKEEGLPQVFQRHQRLAHATRGAVEAIGLKLFAAEAARSDCITSIAMPEGVDGEKVKKLMGAAGVVAAGGQDSLKGAVVRIGHMGYVDANDILLAVNALETALNQVGYQVKAGTAVAAAVEYLSR
jgi:aspartate aminotransferase-like enzyme